MATGSQFGLLKLYGERGKWREVLSLYRCIRSQGFRPDTFTYPILLKACCTHPSLLPLGQSVHADAQKRGFCADPYFAGSLITLYAKCGSLNHARKAFDEIPQPSPVLCNTAISCFFSAGDLRGAAALFERMREPNVVTWSAVISGYTQNGRAKEALLVFRRMREQVTGEGDEDGLPLLPNSNTIAGVLSACVQLRYLRLGMQVHGYVEKASTFSESSSFVGSILIDLYGRCREIAFARKVFDFMVEKCVVAWSTLISVYLINECQYAAIEVSREMVNEVQPNNFTLTMLINACASTEELRLGKELHGFVVRNLVGSDTVVSTALIDMYSKCHSLQYANQVFKMDYIFLHNNRTPMWNALIAGHVRNERLTEAWEFFRSMIQLINGNAKPNEVTLAIILPVCTRSSLLQYGKEVHCYAIKNGLDREVLVGNSLLDMYSKSGKVQWARFHFDRMPQKNRISWTTMIDGYGVQGDGQGAIRIFRSMVREKDIEPDHITFVALISACSHAGLVEEGLKYFKAMEEEFGLTPSDENYGCVVDLLARAGRIKEAKDLIATIPKKPSANVWGALLSACRVHGAVDEAESALKHLLEVDPNEGGFPTLLSNIYAEMGKMDGVAKLREAMRDMEVEKRRGSSWLETCAEKHGILMGVR